MKKVLHYTKTFCPLSQTFILDLVTHIQLSGVESKVATKNIENKESFNNINIVQVGRHKSKLRKRLHRLLGRPLDKCDPLLAKCIDQFRPDIIHCHFGPAGYDVGLLTEQSILNQKIIVSLHGYDVFQLGSFPGRYNRVLCDLQKNGAIFTVPSESLKNSARERLGLSSEGLVVVGNGVNPSFIERHQKSKPNKPLKIGCVGRLVEIKGQKHLIKAVELLQRMGIATQLSIIGEGPLLEKLIDYAKKLEVFENCIFYGSLKHQSISGVLKDLDLYVQPSITMPNGQFESFCVALLEAVACGIPVIATESGGMKEVLLGLQKPFAQIVPEKSPESIALAVKYFIENIDDVDIDLCNSIRLNLIEKFSIKSTTNQIIALYQ